MEGIRTPEMRRTGMLELNLTDRVLKISGIKVKCSPTDFKLLQLLVENAGSVVSVDMISDHLYKNVDPAKTNTIRKHVSRLRDLLMNNRVGNVIETTDSGGYKLNLPKPTEK